MSICKRKLFKALFAALTVGTGAWLLTGCKKVDVHIDDTAVLHEGYDLPQLIVGSAGTAKWENEDTDNKLVAGEHTYTYVYTESSTQKRQTFTVKLSASQHTCDETKEESTNIVKEASCTEDGIKYHVCEICSKQYDQQSIEKLGHNFENIEHVDGDCMNLGYTFQVCSRCNEKKKDASGEPIKTYDTVYGAHTWEVDAQGNEVIKNITKSPQCNEEGEGVVYCKFHGEHLLGEGNTQNIEKTVVLDKVGHNYSVEVHHDGDCMTKGYTEYKCQWCGEYKLAEGSEEHFIKIDENYGAHVWETNQDGSELIHQVTLQPECDAEGSGIVWCKYHDEHAAGQGLTTGTEKTVTIHPVEHNYVREVHTDGDCMHKGYTEYKCQWCELLKMVEGSTTETYKTYDDNFGAHIWTVDAQGNEVISAVTTQATCKQTGEGTVYCIYHGIHTMGQGNTVEDSKTVTIPKVNHQYNEKEYKPYTITSCRTLGEYRLVCVWCGESDPDQEEGEYPYRDTEYLEHRYDENGLCINVYYEILKDPRTQNQIITTRVCGECESDVEKEYNLGGAYAYSEKDSKWHDGTIADPSDSVVAKIVKEKDGSGVWTGKYILYILATQKESEDEAVEDPNYHCFENTYAISNWIINNTMEENFAKYASNFIPWYNELDENFQLYRNLITRVEISPEIQSLPAGLFAEMNGLETITMEGLSSLDQISIGLFYNCQNLVFVGLNDNTTQIGTGAFYNCPSFTTTSIIFPRRLETIREYAFYQTYIGDIDLSECKNLSYIGYAAFQNTHGGIKSVVLPNTHININLGSMSNNTIAINSNSGSFNSKGFAVYVEDDFDEEEYYNDYAENVYVAYTSTYFLGKGHTYANTVHIVDGVEMLFPTEENPIYAKHSLVGNDDTYTYFVEKYTDGVIICNTLDKTITSERLEAVMNYVYDGTNKISDKLVCIGNQAFTDCTQLTRFVVPQSLKEIRDLAFCDCSKLKEIGVYQGEGQLLDFDESLVNLKSIGTRAFQGTALTRVSLPKTIEYLGAALFVNCGQIKDVYYNASYKAYVHYNGTLLDTETLQEKFVEYISFSDLRGILGGMSFASDLTIHIGDNVTILDGIIFDYNGASNLKIDLSNAVNVEEISEYGLSSLNIKELDFSNTKLATIGRGALSRNPYLEKVIFPATEITLEEFFGPTDALFYSSDNLKEIYINGKINTNSYGFKNLGNDENIKVYVAPTVTELPYMFNGGKVSLVIQVAKVGDNYTGYSLVNNAGTYTSNFDSSNIFKNSTVTISFLVNVEEINGSTFAEEFNTALSVEIALSANIDNIPEGYFAALPVTTIVRLDSDSSYVWYDEETSKYCYCGIDKFFQEGVKFYVGEQELTSQHKWDLTNYTKATCEADSEGYRICTICGLKDEEVTTKLGHNYQVSFDNLTTATCSTLGNIHFVCENCGDDYVDENKTIDHEFEFTNVSCLEVGAKAKCVYCNLEANETIAEGHYIFDKETNKFVMIDETTSGSLCVFCGGEVFAFALGENGVTGQMFERKTADTEVTLLVTSSGEGDTTYSFASNYTASPLWTYRNSYDECIIGSKIVNINDAFFWNGGQTKQSLHTSVMYRLVIGENVKTIGDYAFMGLYYIKEIRINANLTSCGYDIFMLANMEESKPLNLYFEEGVTVLPEEAFACSQSGYTGIKNIYLPSTLKSIGDYAFYGCNGSKAYGSPAQNLYFQGTLAQWLEIDMVSPDSNPALSLYNSKTYINGEELKAIIIDADVDTIKPYTLLIPGINAVSVDPANNNYKVVNGALIDTRTKTLVFAVSYAIPDDGSVEIIGVGAFAGSDITKVTIPASVKTIEDFAFYGCSKLTEVDLGAGVETIGDYAFYGCSVLKTIYVPKTLTLVNESAFKETAIVNTCYAGTQDEFNLINVIGSGNTKFTGSFCPFFDITGKTVDELVAVEGQKYWYIDSEGNRKLVPTAHVYVTRDANDEEKSRCVSSVTYCEFCGTSIEHIGHTIGETVIVPDCATGGALNYECEVCHETINKVIEHIGHYNTFGEIITTPGEKCAFCGKIVVDVVTLGADGVVAQVTYHGETTTAHDILVVASSTGTEIDALSSRSDNTPIVAKYYTTAFEIAISDDITSIGQSSFATYQKNWVVLKKITLGKNITNIGAYCFYGIPACTDIYYNCINATANTSGHFFAMLGTGGVSGATIHVSKDVQQLPQYLLYGSSYSPKIANIYIEKGSNLTSMGKYTLYSNGYKGYTFENFILSKTMTGVTAVPYYSAAKTGFTSATNVFFTGNADEYETFKTSNTGFAGGIWNATTKADISKIYFYSETTPAEPGNYWHYAEDGFTPVIWVVE